MSAWIPALHAGMTHRGVLLKVTEAPPACIFEGAHEGHEGFGYFYYSLRALRGLRGSIYFSLLAFWVRLSRAVLFMVNFTIHLRVIECNNLSQRFSSFSYWSVVKPCSGRHFLNPYSFVPLP